MKEKLARFMYGRYGTDRFGRTLIVGALVLLLISTFARSSLLYVLSVTVLLYTYFRTFSRNIQARYKEEMAYERFIGKFKKIPVIGKQFQSYKIFKCPDCGQKIRIPRHKGRIEITCPKCKTRFIRKS